MTVQMLNLAGKTFAVIPLKDFQALQKRAAHAALPKLPGPLANGNFPARQTLRALYARKLSQERQAAGLSQAQLAKRAGLRVETINRLEKGKHSPDLATVNKIVNALRG